LGSLMFKSAQIWELIQIWVQENDLRGVDMELGAKITGPSKKPIFGGAPTSPVPNKPLIQGLDKLTQIDLANLDVMSLQAKEKYNSQLDIQALKMLKERRNMINLIITNYDEIRSETIKPDKQVPAKFFCPTSYVFLGCQDEPACKKEMAKLVKIFNSHDIRAIKSAGDSHDKDNIIFGERSYVSRWTQDFIEFHKNSHQNTLFRTRLRQRIRQINRNSRFPNPTFATGHSNNRGNPR